MRKALESEGQNPITYILGGKAMMATSVESKVPHQMLLLMLLLLPWPSEQVTVQKYKRTALPEGLMLDPQVKVTCMFYKKCGSA